MAESEDDAFAQIRRFLSFMPQNVWELPPRLPADDPVDRCEEELLGIVPEQRTRPYDMKKLVALVVDKDSAFEIRPTYGRAVITMLARLGGRPVGIVANNPKVYGGAMDADAARKQIHFMELCDTFHIPLVFLVDVPGFMVGLKAEQEGTLREGMRAVYLAGQLKIPTLTLVIRKCYGMAGMATCNKNDIDLKLAWPSGEWGSLPVEGGVAAAFRREIEAADDPKAREAGTGGGAAAPTPPPSAPPKRWRWKRSSTRAKPGPSSANISLWPKTACGSDWAPGPRQGLLPRGRP